MRENKKHKNPKTWYGKLWHYIWYGDSLGSYILNFLLAFVVIKYIFFPTLGFMLNNDYPIVAIVSGSMEHKIVDNKICDKIVVDERNKNLNFDEWWSFCGNYYLENTQVTQEQFLEFPFKRGLNIGDVMILYGKKPENIEIGEILVFVPGDKQWFSQYGPVIHRVVDKWEEDGKWKFTTKGDHNPIIIENNNFEDVISEDQVIAVGVVRIPYLGYGKILLNNVLLLFR